jgi:hypothetical protein
MLTKAHLRSWSPANPIQDFGPACLPYVLKTMNDRENAIDFQNMDLYLNAVDEGNHKQRRRIERHNRRLIVEQLKHG